MIQTAFAHADSLWKDPMCCQKPNDYPLITISAFAGVETLQYIAELHLETHRLLRQLSCQCPPNNLIGIPSIEGMEFLKVDEIIRCEGLQRLTKVYTGSGAIISSYNIGEFSRMLCSHGFFLPHKSHLINLQYLRSYHQEGSITLRDGAHVPLARRRKDAFFERVRHL